LASVNQDYIVKAEMTGGVSMRDAQRKVSKRIVGLLGINFPEATSH